LIFWLILLLYSSIGASTNRRNLTVLELGLQNRSKTALGYPAIVYVGNLHG